MSLWMKLHLPDSKIRFQQEKHITPNCHKTYTKSQLNEIRLPENLYKYVNIFGEVNSF